MREQMISNYRLITAAEGYIIGFVLGTHVYFILLDEINDNWIKLGRQSKSHGGRPQLKLYVDAKSKRAMVANHKAIYIGEAEELQHERWNRGDMFEKMIVERIAGKAWVKINAAFWEEGDTKINNREIQIKLDSAEITNEKTLARGMRTKGLAA